MAKVTETRIVCDGCAETLAENVKGSSVLHVDEVGSEHTRKIELCPACTEKLPEGTKRKRPEKKAK